MSILEQKKFIKSIHPFGNLDDSELDELLKKLDVVYYKENHTIQNIVQNPTNLHFIIKGVVQELNDNEVVTIYSNNEFFDPKSLIENKSKNSFITVSETICYMLPRDQFLYTMYHNEHLESFFFQSISQKLNQSMVDDQNKEFVNFMVARVKDAYLAKPYFVDSTTSIFEAVKFMKEKKATAILVKKDEKLGIVTDSDFRQKVILNRIDFDECIEKIATFGLITTNSDDFLFNAQLTMTKHGIKRLLVEDNDGNIVGILDLIALTSFFASHAYSVMLEVDRASSVQELKNASLNYIRIIRTLFAKGVKVRYISRILTQLNGKLFAKLFDILASDDIKQNVSLIIMGSEGRGEQILRTDQDNALIVSDNSNIDEKILENFANEFSNTLCDFGYPRCKGEIMVDNSYWRLSEKEWKNRIYEWIHSNKSDDFMNLAIFYDATTVYGDTKMLDDIKEYFYSICQNSPSFNSNFAKAVLSFETPLSMFANFIVDKKSHKNELDLKKGGIFPIVHGVRSLSIEYKIKSTNSVERIKELNNIGLLDREFAGELIEAFNFLLSLRLKNRLDKLDSGLEPNNFINPTTINTLQRDLLRDSFKIVDKFKKYLTYHYKLHLLG